MMGLLFLGALAFWCLMALVLVLLVVRWLPRHWIRWPLGLLLLAGLLVLPVVDEIRGGHEFAELCRAASTIDVDREKAAGRRVYEAHAEFREVEGTHLRVLARQSDFIDADTGKKLIGFRTLTAWGGGLSEGLRFSETRVPLTFDGNCDPGGQGRLAALFKELRITLVRRPVRPINSPSPSRD